MKKEFLEFHAEFCKTFSNPKRLEILDLLILGELTADEIAAKLSLKDQRISAREVNADDADSQDTEKRH